MNNMTLTIEKYHPLYIDDIRNLIFSFTDTKDIIHLKNTNLYLSNTSEIYTSYLKKCHEIYIRRKVHNFLRTENYIKSVKNIYKKEFKMIFYKDLFEMMIKKNLYHPKYTITILDITLDHKGFIDMNVTLFANKMESLTFLSIILNKNINKIIETKRIEFWNNFLKLGNGSIGYYNKNQKLFLVV